MVGLWLGLVTFLMLSHQISAQSGNNPQQCTQPHIRKEWRELSEQRRQDYIKSNLCLKQLPSKLNPSIKSPSRWDDFVYVHWAANDHAHKGAPFLPWHRHFLRLFEQALQVECGYNGTLPFWDFAMDSQAPERSPIFQYFGTDGRQSDHCVETGPFRNWTSTFPWKRCLTRKFDHSDPKSGPLMSALYTPIQIELVIASFKTYPGFRQALEDHPHNMIHYGIGGDMFDPTTSTNDPIFWVHHANVDRIWLSWQQRNPTLAYTYGGNRVANSNTTDAQSSDRLHFWGLAPDILVRDAFYVLYPQYCYMYSHSVLPLKKGSQNGAPGATVGGQGQQQQGATNGGQVQQQPTGVSGGQGQKPTTTTQQQQSNWNRTMGSFISGQSPILPPIENQQRNNNLNQTLMSAVRQVVDQAAATQRTEKSGLQKRLLVAQKGPVSFSSWKGTTSPNPRDRVDMDHIRQNAPLPLHFLSKHKSPQEIARIRAFEERMRGFVDQVNAQGWESNAALKYVDVPHRPAKAKEFHARRSQMRRLISDTLTEIVVQQPRI